MAAHREPSWRWRRVTTFIILAFCGAMLWRLIDALDSEINRQLAQGAWALAAIVALGYLGLATVQDVIAIWRTGRGMPYDPPDDGAKP